MNTIATDWADVQPPEADEADEVAAVAGEEPKPEEVTAPTETYQPVFEYGLFPQVYRVGAVPEALRPFLIEAKAEGYTPPFYVNRSGSTRSIPMAYPGCPPIEPGGKALAFDDWGNPKVVAVTSMHNGEIRAMLGAVPVQYQAWVAMSAEAPLTVPEPTDNPARLTDEEADALEAELFEWSKFLGFRAAKYQWCGTFENILKDVGVKPWRPGFKSVTLQVDIKIDAKGFDVAEKIGGETEVRSITAITLITIKDVSRDDYENGRWQPLLKKAGYKNITGGIYVHSKEAMSL